MSNISVRLSSKVHKVFKVRKGELTFNFQPYKLLTSKSEICSAYN